MTQGGKKPTKAERKEQLRQQRLAEMKRRQRKSRMRKIWTGVIAAVIVLAVAGLIWLSGRSGRVNEQQLNRLATTAGCTTVQEPADDGQGHTSSPTETVTYRTKPPTSGKHAPQWDKTGVHSSPIRNETQVHNLEHGHVLIQYKPDIDQAFIDKLEGIAKRDPTRIIVAPYSDMDAKLALTAWTRLSTCNEVKDDFIEFARKFADVYKGKGPEGDIPGTPA